MTDDKQNAADRRIHMARLKNALSHCVSSRQRRWLREAICVASRSSGSIDQRD